MLELYFNSRWKQEEENDFVDFGLVTKTGFDSKALACLMNSQELIEWIRQSDTDNGLENVLNFALNKLERHLKIEIDVDLRSLRKPVRRIKLEVKTKKDVFVFESEVRNVIGGTIYRKDILDTFLPV